MPWVNWEKWQRRAGLVIPSPSRANVCCLKDHVDALVPNSVVDGNTGLFVSEWFVIRQERM